MKLKDLPSQLIQKNAMGAVMDKEDELVHNPTSIKALPTSPVRFNIPSGLMERTEKPPMDTISLPHMLASVRGIQKSMRDLAKNPVEPRTQITPDALDALESYAKSRGVNSIGYVKLPRHLIFRDKAVLYDGAIVMTMEMDKRKMDTAPSPQSHLAAMEIYHHLGDASNAVANYLRKQGHAAHAGHPLMGLTLYPPLAQMAGLGWRGRHGLLLTPEFGPRVRLAAVFTSIENLPWFSGENPHSWIPDYCKTCGQCIKQCPTKAIYKTPIPRENDLVSCVDMDKCFPQFADHHGCSVCIRVCPFNRRLYDKLKHHVMQNHTNTTD